MSFALRSNPGAYAVLVGSGVSVGAAIPSVCQMVLDLNSKAAKVVGENPEDDMPSWRQGRPELDLGNIG